MPASTPLFDAWASYYVIVGSSAGALTGLQFVVMALAAGMQTIREDSVAAFGSPNIVHFCAALLISAVLSIPWHTTGQAGAAVAVLGGGGVLYSAIVLRRALRQGGYEPVLEDWVWHTILPAVAYLTLFVSGLRIAATPVPALFAVAGAVLLLVFIGIHNAWDTVMYLTVLATRSEGAPSPSGSGGGGPPASAPPGPPQASLPPGATLG